MSDNLPTKPDSQLVGRLRKYHSNFYYVEAEGVLYECALRGLIKKEGGEVLVGDFVALDSVDAIARTARISRVLQRKNAISRPKLANVDQVLVVYSLRDPVFDPHQMDRYLTHIELVGLTPTLCISKADLAQSDEELNQICQVYEQTLGYQVIFTTVKNQDSLNMIRELAQGKITVLAGPSGSGKSSLLNSLNQGLQLRVGEISEKIARGQHTTRHVELLSLFENSPDTLIADTPGFSNLKFNYILPIQLEGAFRDFAPYRSQCAFSDCLHVDEEGCNVLLNRAAISESRYQSYLDLLAEARLYKDEMNSTSQKQEFGYKQLDRKGKDSVRILRLKEKNRDSSRRTQKQQVRLLDVKLTEDPEDDTPEDRMMGPPVEEDPSGSV